jgi:hypothetical protein
VGPAQADVESKCGGDKRCWREEGRKGGCQEKKNRSMILTTYTFNLKFRLELVGA